MWTVRKCGQRTPPAAYDRYCPVCYRLSDLDQDAPDWEAQVDMILYREYRALKAHRSYRGGRRRWRH